MTSNSIRKPQPVSQDVAMRILNGMEAAAAKWDRRGYCPCCIARTLLMSAGLLAAHELQPDDLREALGYITEQAQKHAPPPDASRH
jgi:hypothetical protein